MIEVKKSFAPITITINTPDDLKDFINMMEKVEDGCINRYFTHKVMPEAQLARRLIETLRT